MIILEKMLVLFLLMVIGYIACKKQMITNEVEKKVSGIIVNIANPAIILSAVVSDESVSIPKSDVIYTLEIAIPLYCTLIILGEFIPKILKVGKEDYGMFRVMTVFSNMGYMGFPIILSVYGSKALIYASIFLIPFNVLIYTYGILAIKNHIGHDKIHIRSVLNNGVIACLIMIFLLVTGITLPSVLSDMIETVAGMTVPLCMMMIGASLVKVQIKKLFWDKRLLMFSIIKLIIIPALGILICKQFVKNQMLLGVILIVLATPVGSLTAMLAKEYGGNDITASKGIAITTLLSVITIPIVFLLIQ